MLLIPNLVKYVNKIKKIFHFTILLLTINACHLVNTRPKNLVNIAILLPFEDKTIPAVEYASFIKTGLSDSTKIPIKVTHYDSSNDLNLAKSVNQIIDDGIDIIIGPISNQHSKYVNMKVADKKIVTLSFANDPSLAKPYHYILGHMPTKQLTQAIDYFLNQDYQNFIAILPFGRQSNLTNKLLSYKINSHSETSFKTHFYNSENSAEVIQSVADMVNELSKNIENEKPVILLPSNLVKNDDLHQQLKLANLDENAIIVSDNILNTQIPINYIFSASNKLAEYDLNEYFIPQNTKNLSFLHLLAYDIGQIIGDSIGNLYRKKSFLQNIDSVTNFAGFSGYITMQEYMAIRYYDLILYQQKQYRALTNIKINQNE